ncbi:TRAP transporter small permease [Pelagibius sp.]|uniref:TRAP transporter small permease n=1 Tax=Pelagibius sp. TaxID=1931238 RepID=UPI002613382A|nr:TRAP transporter small permease [Pelagibius sp.]
MGRKIFHFLDNIESYICRTLLAIFVTLLFAQILSREFFNYSFSWSEELATYMFVWFVFFGASYAAKLYAHNRVTFQFNKLPKKVANTIEAIADLFWIAFNVYFVYLSFNFVFFKMNLFWKSQTLGVPMKYIYLILPIAFTLMTIRILQANYMKLVKGVDVRDPEKAEVEKMIKEGQ